MEAPSVSRSAPATRVVVIVQQELFAAPAARRRGGRYQPNYSRRQRYSW